MCILCLSISTFYCALIISKHFFLSFMWPNVAKERKNNVRFSHKIAQKEGVMIIHSMQNEVFKACVCYFLSIFLFFHQMIAHQKLWKVLFISSKRLFLFLRYTIFFNFFPFLINFRACVRYFLSNFYFSPNDSPSKTTKNAFYFI